ncbi:hypothetical protein D3C83_204710 [compost metagenome]
MFAALFRVASPVPVSSVNVPAVAVTALVAVTLPPPVVCRVTGPPVVTAPP